MSNPPAKSPLSLRSGGIPLFRLFGIQVSLHWLWAVVAVYEINARRENYKSIAWNIAEYLTLFLIVLMHEFGHALACRSVGGKADRILLWPLGGVAFVRPPQRPGAVLWSIVAGPLVNVVLIPITFGLLFWAEASGFSSDVQKYFWMTKWINLGLLIFNLLPIYPLDGGQILQSLLWFFLGRARSLIVATILGMIGTAAGLMLLLSIRQSSEGRIWTILLAVFAASQCWRGLTYARALSKLMKLPRVHGFECPSCHEAPPAMAGKCACGQELNPFELAEPVCPNCGARFGSVGCIYCGAVNPIDRWRTAPPSPYQIPQVAIDV